MKYMLLDTGDLYTLDEIRKAYDDFKDEMDQKYVDFEEYLDMLLDLGRQRIGGFIEVEE